MFDNQKHISRFILIKLQKISIYDILFVNIYL